MVDSVENTDALEPAVWHLYVLLCDNSRLYTGITTDVARRVRQHRGELRGGAKFTHAAQVVELVYAVQIGSHTTAARAEYRLKQFSHRQKQRLVSAHPTAAELLEQLTMSNEQ